MSEEQSKDGVSIHTGFPNPAADTALRGLDLNQLLIAHSASTYFFRIEGNQWQDSGIFDGDIAIIDRALDARATDLVVWWSADQSTFAISTRKTVPLDAVIWGVVTATIHQFRKTGLAHG